MPHRCHREFELTRCCRLYVGYKGPVLLLESAALLCGSMLAAIGQEAETRVPPDGCYLLYSSGSTGTPKGVLGSRHAAAHLETRPVLPPPVEGGVSPPRI